MIKTQFPYSLNGQDFLVIARCFSVDSLNAAGLKIKLMDEETLDYIDVQFDPREYEELEEYAMEKLDEQQHEMELGYV